MHLTCTNHLFGFTAAAQVHFYGGDGKELGSAAQDLGVGSDLFTTTHRDWTWTTQAPDGTQGIGLSQYWDPHPRVNIDLGPLGQQIGAFFNDIGTFLAAAFDAPVEWCNQNPNDCNNLMFVLFVLGGTALCLSGLIGDCDVVITVIASPG